VLGTSMASRSLFEAQNRGVAVDAGVLKRAESYTVSALSAAPPPPAPVAGGGVAGGRVVGAPAAPCRGGWWARREGRRCRARPARRSCRRPAVSECAGAGAVEPHHGG